MNWFLWGGFIAVLALLTNVVVLRQRARASASRLESLRDQSVALEQSMREASSELARYRNVMAQAELGILLMDGSGAVVDANSAAAEFVGARHGAALAESRIQQLARDAAASGEAATAELEVRVPRPRTLRMTATPLDGWTVAYVEDISQRKQIDATRTDFIANVSHELKTPLGALMLLSETLATAQDPAARARLIGRIGEQASRMTRLVDDILDLSQVEAAAIEPTVVDLDRVVTEAAVRVGEVADAAGVDLSVVAADGGIKVLGDERQLVSAAANLLSNAITYTADSAPPRTVRARAYVAGGSAVIEVADTGIGIPVAHQQRIFERFYQVDKARRRETGGTGLGLAIVRHVARNHGGNVELESESGVGSTFRIVIPAGDAL